MISLWTFFWLVGGEVSRSQHHQPSGSIWSGGYVDVGNIASLTVNFSRLVGISLCAKQLRDIVVCIRWWGTKTLPQGCTTVSLDSLFLPGLTSPPFPNEQLLESARWNSGKVMEAEWSLLPITKKWETQRGFVPRSPTELC